MINKEPMLATSQKKEIKTPLNFKVVDGNFTADDVLNAFFSGKDSILKELKEQINTGLQLSSISSNYLFEKLKNESINIQGMYLRFVTPKEFDTLVIIADEDYYDKNKRWNAYNYAREINQNLADISLNFSFIPFSEEIDNSIIASDGFAFKYDDKKNH